MFKLLVCHFCLLSIAFTQHSFILFQEAFDSTTPPSLPTGWGCSTNRSAAGDFSLTTSSPRSSPYALITSNATISQSLMSPLIEFEDCTPVRLTFYISRSSTHTSPLIIEASVDGGLTFPFQLSDTLRNPGGSGYVLTSIPLHALPANASNAKFRWRLVGVPGAGSSGTLRLDDVTLTAQLSHDLAVTHVAALPSSPAITTDPSSVTIAATIKNVGTLTARDYSVEFFRDQNGDGLPVGGERLSSQPGLPLPPADSLIVSTPLCPILAGENRFIARVVLPNDRNPLNDTASTTVLRPSSPRSVVINEMMVEPAIGQNEWVELFNRTSDAVDIGRWRISDRPTASGVNSFVLSQGPLSIPPHSYVTIAADSSLLSRYTWLRSHDPNSKVLILNRPSGFGFNNDGDDVVLRDFLGTTIDSVSYLPTWHHPDIVDPKGRSLERVNPDLSSNDSRNWSTSSSRDGGTPGRQNGIYTVVEPSSSSLFAQPNPFSPDGDGFEDFCALQYALPATAPLIRISIFDRSGRLVKVLVNTEPGGSRGEIIWNGLDDSNMRVRIGPYIVLLEGVDRQGNVLSTAKIVVIVAGKLQ